MAAQQAQLQAMLEGAVMQQVQQQEAKLDQQMKALEMMDNEELEEMEAIRKRRMDYMRKAKERKQIGHGEYTEIGGCGNEKEFFDAAKLSDKFVCHFYRESTPRCQIMDMHLAKLARKHTGTRFVKIDAERAPFLAEKLRIIMLPTVALVIKGKVKDYIMGFDDLGGADDFDTEVLEWRMGNSGVIHYDGVLEGPSSGKRQGFVGRQTEKKKRYTRDGAETDSDDDFD